MICSLGVPVNLELESITIGYSLKSSFYLPSNTSNFWSFSDPFNVLTSPNYVVGRSERGSGYDVEQQERFERNMAEMDVVDSGTIRNDVQNSNMGNHFGTTRWLVYKGLAGVADK